MRRCQIDAELTEVTSSLSWALSTLGREVARGDLGMAGAGRRHWVISVPELDSPAALQLSVESDGVCAHATADAEPVRDWTVSLVQHSHTDLGYTGLQNEVFEDHVRFIELACQYADQTRDLPPDEQFRWVCESCWAVEKFLDAASPEQIEKLRRIVSEGRIEITALYYQFTDMVSHAELSRSLDWASRVGERLGAPVTAALNCDVNGWSWALPQLLCERGVKRFATAINWYRGGAPEPCPGLFWWEAPGGSRVLVHNGQHYHLGNAIGFHENYQTVVDRLPGHLAGILKSGYPYQNLLLQLSGEYADNSAPALRSLDIIRQWNAEFARPRLKSDTITGFFDSFEPELADKPAPVLHGDWTDWWADGNSTSAREVTFVRRAQQELRSAGAIYGAALLSGDASAAHKLRQIDAAWHDVAAFDEHTFGAAASISEPWSPMTLAQWASKSSNAYRAAVVSERQLSDALSLIALPSSVPSICVTNTETWDRCDLAQIELALDSLPNKREFHLIDYAGQRVRHQLVSERPGFLTIAFVADIPGSSSRSYTIQPCEKWDERRGATRPSDENYYWTSSQGHFSTSSLTLIFSDRDGDVFQLTDGKGNPIITDLGAWNPFDMILEVPDKGRSGLELSRSNRGYSRLEFERQTAKWQLALADCGPVYMELVRRSSLPGLPNIEQRFRLCHELNWLDVELTIDKLPDTRPQSIYMAVPFASGLDSRLTLDKALTWFEADSEQLPGSARDYYTASSWVQATEGDDSFVLALPDTPMVQLGGLHVGKWLDHLPPQDGLVMVWIANNYWTTNFPASQHGPLKLRFRIAAAPDASPQFATRLGWSTSNPLRAQFVPASSEPVATRSASPRMSLVSSGDSVFIADIAPSENAGEVLVRLWNVGCENSEFTLSLPSEVSHAFWKYAPPQGSPAPTIVGKAITSNLPPRSHALLAVRTQP